MIEDEDLRAGSLAHYGRIIRRRRLTVLLIVVVALVAAALVTLKQSAVYQAQSKIVVGQGLGDSFFQAQNGGSIQPFTATMADLLTSNVVAQRVNSSLGLNESPSTLLSKVSVAINPQTAVMTVTVSDTNAQRAQQINAAFGGAFALIVQERFAKPNTQAPISATVFDPAYILPGRASPSLVRNLLIAGILGLLLGVAAALLRDHLDPKLHSEEELQDAFRAPVIGRIPALRRRAWNARLPGAHTAETDDIWDDRRDALEAYRVARATLRSQGSEHPLRNLLVSSVAPGCGKEVVAANLARAFASTGAPTLLVEADLEQPLLDWTISAPGSMGLAELLAGNSVLTQAIDNGVGPRSRRRHAVADGAEEVGHPQSRGPLAFLPAGPARANASDLLAGTSMGALMEDAASAFDYVLLNAPPLLRSADALELVRTVDAVILVVRPDDTRRDQAAEVLALLNRVGVHLAGLVIAEPGVPARARRREPQAASAPDETVGVGTAAGGVSER